jgi:hypothetical protein
VNPVVDRARRWARSRVLRGVACRGKNNYRMPSCTGSEVRDTCAGPYCLEHFFALPACPRCGAPVMALWAGYSKKGAYVGKVAAHSATCRDCLFGDEDPTYLARERSRWMEPSSNFTQAQR